MITEKVKHPGTLLEPETNSVAVFSDCKIYRYYLEWRWSDAPMLYVCMLNPSTATAHKLDPTIAGLVKRAKAWGYGGVVIINLFGFRATKPTDMLIAPDPVGPDNDATIFGAMRQAFDVGSPLICAWGNDGAYRKRNKQVITMAADSGIELMAFDINGSGEPKHPLYVKHDIRPQQWTPAI